jgi:hypothetical protein
VDDIEKHLYDQMLEIFGADFEDIQVIGERLSDEIFDVLTESYFFVKCCNYYKYVETIKNCDVVSLVLPSFQNPETVPENSIKKFSETTRSKLGTSDSIACGDFVRVRDGYLKNLWGIVLSVKKEKCVVNFRLHTKVFNETIHTKNILKSGKSIFQFVKIPVKENETTMEMLSPVVTKIIGEETSFANKICRGLYRSAPKKSTKRR